MAPKDSDYAVSIAPQRINLAAIPLSLRPIQPAGRGELTRSLDCPDNFALSASWGNPSISVSDLKAPGQKTDKVLAKFAGHPLASMATEDIAAAKELLTTTATRASKRKTPAGIEHFYWRHLYLEHHDKSVSTIWRWWVSLQLQKTGPGVIFDWREVTPVLTVALVNAWELMPSRTPEYGRMVQHVADIRKAIALDLVNEALSEFSYRLEDFNEESTLPVHVRVLVGPDALHHAKTATELVSAIRSSTPITKVNNLRSERRYFEDFRNLVVTGVEAGHLDEKEYSAILAEEKPPGPTAKTDEPQDTYIFLESPCSKVLITEKGRAYPLYLKERYDYFLRKYGCTPKELIKIWGCNSKEFKELEVRPEPSYSLNLRKIAEWLRLTTEIEAEDEIIELARDLDRAEDAPGGFKHEGGLVIRILADKATNVSYAWVGFPTEPVLGFIEKALSGGIVSPLQGLPRQLQVAAAYVKKNPSVEHWCAENGVQLTAPNSGFSGGIHLIRNWAADLDSMNYHKDVNPGKPGWRLVHQVPNKEGNLKTVAQVQRLMETTCWAPMAINHRRADFGYSSMKPDWERYFKVARPTDDVADLLNRRFDWEASHK